MPWTDAQYQKAGELLAGGTLKPETAKALEARVREHEATMPAPDTANPTVTLPETEVSGTAPDRPPEDRVLAEQEKVDQNLPTASKLKDPAFVRDPEFHPPPPPPGFHPLAAAAGALPTYLGGNVVQWHEPSFQQFLRDGGKGDEASPDFAKYRDAQWVKAYDAAKGDGTPIVRREYANHEGWTNQVLNAVDQADQLQQAAVMGFQDTAGFGIPAALASWGSRHAVGQDMTAGLQESQENHPIASTVGKVAGLVTPSGLANKAVSSLGELGGVVGDALGQTTNIGQAAQNAAEDSPVAARIAKGALGGAVGAGIQSGGESLTKIAKGDTDLHSSTRAALESMLFGGGLGAGAGAIGAGASALRSGLRKDIPALAEAEKAGIGTTSAVSGVKTTPRGSALYDEARAATTTPQDIASEELERPMAGVVRQRNAVETAATEKTNRAYYEATRTTKQSMGPVLDAAMDAHKDMAEESGDPVAFQKGPAAELRRHINDLATVHPTDAAGEQGALRAAQAKNPDARAVDAFEARRLGIDVDRFAGPEGHPDDLQYIIVPKSYNPQQADASIDGINRLLKVANSVPGADNPALEVLGSAARKVRDRFPDMPHILGTQRATISDPESGRDAAIKGWNAFKEKEASGRLNDYLGYGHIDTNEKLRLGEDAGPDANALVRDLRKTEGTPGTYHRAQHMSLDDLAEASASGKLTLKAPTFVSSNPAIADNALGMLGDVPEHAPVRMTIDGSAVDVSGHGQGRPGEALIPPGTFTVKKIAAKDGVVHMALQSATPGERELTGWGAFKHNVSEGIAPQVRQAEMAGLPAEPKPELSADQANRFKGTAKQYGKPGNRERDTALAEIARQGNASATLRDIAGTNAYDALVPQAKLRGIVTNGGFRERIPVTAARLRLDPMMGRLAAPGFAPRAGLLGAGAATDDNRRTPLLDLLQIP